MWHKLACLARGSPSPREHGNLLVGGERFNPLVQFLGCVSTTAYLRKNLNLSSTVRATQFLSLEQDLFNLASVLLKISPFSPIVFGETFLIIRRIFEDYMKKVSKRDEALSCNPSSRGANPFRFVEKI
jgi:hypothetical protein